MCLIIIVMISLYSTGDTLEKIADEISHCLRCKLSQSRRNAVPGDGRMSAKILFIGEAPGKYEDEKGKPFVGAAGKILNDALEKAGIERSLVFITNLVKCRPPGNRIPEEDERSACRSYLERQVSLVAPKIICVLGRTAYSSILGGKSIIADRGRIVQRDRQKYFLTIHPASAIYNKSLHLVLYEDIRKLSKELKKMETEDTKRLLDST
jgi:uracil-DNA glycosylase